MGLFHKKEKVPDLPPANAGSIKEPPIKNSSTLTSKKKQVLKELPKKDSPDLPPANAGSIKEPLVNTSSDLPSLPKGLGEDLGREIVKSAITDEQMEVSIASENNDNLIPSVPEDMRVSPMENMGKTENSGKPLFVKIDDFQDARSELIEIEKKIKIVEASVKRFNGVKAKEDKELTNLVSELGEIKEKITKIDSGIFDKI